MSQIVGKKVSNVVVFNVDGQQSVDAAPRPLKDPKVKPQKAQKGPSSAKVKETKVATIEPPRAVVVKAPPNVVAPPPVVAAPTTSRKFMPLAQQFPNLVKSLSTKEPTHIVREDSESDYSDDSGSSWSNEFEGGKENKAPLKQSEDEPHFDSEHEEAKQMLLLNPERHPLHAEQQQQRVTDIVRESNKQFKLSKQQIQQERDRKLQEKRSLRKQLQQQYGKQLTIQLKVQDPQKQKYSWGQNQAREKEEDVKQKQLRKEKEQSTKVVQELRQQRQKTHEQIAQLFPESQGRSSRFRKIWEEEATRSCSRKKTDASPKKDPVPVQRKKKSIDSALVIQNIEESAKKLLLQQKKEKLQKKQEILLKKHKVEYIDREAKAILKKTRMRTFVPNEKSFEAIAPPQPAATYQDEQYEQVEPPSHSEIKLKAPDQFTKAEIKVKTAISKELKLERRIQRERDRQLKKAGIVQPVQEVATTQHRPATMHDMILDEAYHTLPTNNNRNIPRLAHDQQDDEEATLEFRAQVEQEIKRSLFKQRQRKSPKKQTSSKKLLQRPVSQFEPDIEDLRLKYEIKTDMPPPLELRKRAQRIKEIGDRKIKRVYKSQEPKTLDIHAQADPRYPIYHDLGETNLLEDDMHNAKYQVNQLWDTRQKRGHVDSDYEEEQEYVVNSGFYKDILPFTKVNQKSVREVADKTLKRLRNKSVTFQDQSGYRTDESSKYIDAIEQNKRHLSQLVNKQQTSFQTTRQKQNVLLQGKYTTDDDTDDNYLLHYDKQVWHVTDPINRDIFTLSAKQLMELPQIDL